MQIQSKFKSTYGLALYENCIRFQNISHTPWFDMTTFRKLMGVSEDKYTVFRDFKRRVLDKAMAEVNEYAPITVSAQFKRRARQVVALQFLISRIKPKTLSKGIANEENELTNRLTLDFGLSEHQVKKTLDSYSKDYILEKLSIIESSPSFQHGKIKNLAKYLDSALTQNFQPHKSIMMRVQEVSQKSINAKKENKKREQCLDRCRSYQSKAILSMYEEFDDEKKKSLEQEFEQTIKNNIYYDLFLKNKLGNVLVADRFCDFMKKMHPECLLNLMSFDDFAMTVFEGQ